MDWRSRIFDMTSYFRDGGHDVRPPLGAASASAGCHLARRAHVTSTHCFAPLQFLV